MLERATAKRPREPLPDGGQLVDDLESVLAIEAARSGETTGEATVVLQGLPAGRPASPQAAQHPRRLLVVAPRGGGVAVAAVVLASRVEEGRTGGASPPGQPELSGFALERGDRRVRPGGDRWRRIGVAGFGDERQRRQPVDDLGYRDLPVRGLRLRLHPGGRGARRGLTIDAGEPVAAQRLDLTVASEAGWDLDVYGATEIPDTLEDWGEPIGGVTGVGEEQAIELDTGGARSTATTWSGSRASRMPARRRSPS